MLTAKTGDFKKPDRIKAIKTKRPGAGDVMWRVTRWQHRSFPVFLHQGRPRLSELKLCGMSMLRKEYHPKIGEGLCGEE